MTTTVRRKETYGFIQARFFGSRTRAVAKRRSEYLQEEFSGLLVVRSI